MSWFVDAGSSSVFGCMCTWNLLDKNDGFNERPFMHFAFKLMVHWTMKGHGKLIGISQSENIEALIYAGSITQKQSEFIYPRLYIRAIYCLFVDKFMWITLWFAYCLKLLVWIQKIPFNSPLNTFRGGTLAHAMDIFHANKPAFSSFFRTVTIAIAIDRCRQLQHSTFAQWRMFQRSVWSLFIRITL